MAEKLDKNFTEAMRQAFETIEIADVLTEPLTSSIENMLQISALDLNSDEGSVLIRDGNEGALRFLSVIGKVADQLVNMRVPAGKGIAGFVLSSGQPMVVADVAEEESFYREMDEKTGYSTQMILATPLRYNGEIIGVLEYVNRRGDPPFEPFTPADMDKAAMYAESFALLVNAYESGRIINRLAEHIIKESEQTEGLSELRSWIEDLPFAPEHKEVMETAVLLRELSNRGDAERKLCRNIIETILNYSDSRVETKFFNY